MAAFDTTIFQLLALIGFLLVLYLGLWYVSKQQMAATGSQTFSMLSFNLEQWMKYFIFLIAGLFFLILVIWQTTSYSKKITEEGFLAKEGFAAGEDLLGQKSLYSELVPTLSTDERYLINLQPLTARVGGFMGPIEKGNFNAAEYVRKAYQAGVRSFVLPISRFIDDNKRAPDWPPSGGPAIVFRNEQRTITSTNGMRVSDFARALIMSLQENAAQSQEPVVLYLLAEQEVPDPIDNEQLYVAFMHDLAKELKVLDTNRLQSAGQKGSAVGGQAERAILMEMPLEDLKGKVLIATNFQTSLALKDKYRGMSPSLHQYANFILQPMTGGNETGSTIPNVVASSGNVSNASVLLKLDDVTGSKVPWSEQSRTIWHAALNNSMFTSPKPEDVENAVKKGIQSVALPFFYTNEEDQKQVRTIWKTWNGFAYRVKEKDVRYVKPRPVDVKPADPRLSAVAAPGLQPGQLAVK